MVSFAAFIKKNGLTQKSIAKIVIYTSDITTPSVTIDLYAKKNDTWDFDNERDAFAQQVCASIKAIIANQ